MKGGTTQPTQSEDLWAQAAVRQIVSRRVV